MHKPVITIDQRNFAAEAAHCLRQLQSNIAAADHEKMFRYFIQFECFDMGEGLRFSKARNWFERSACAGVDDHIGSLELPGCSVRERGLQCSRADEAPGAEDEFSAGLLVVAEIHVIPIRYHFAFAFANSAHINAEVSLGDAELFASAKVRGHLRAVNDILARQTRDVWARTANVSALDHCDALSFAGKRPCCDRRSRAATENHQIKIFQP